MSRLPVIVVWSVLVAATCLSWWVGADRAIHTADVVAAIVVAVAFIKVRLIGIHFMELGRAPVALRSLFEGYAVVVPAVLLILYVVM
jgi:hypothetical protein